MYRFPPPLSTKLKLLGLDDIFLLSWRHICLLLARFLLGAPVFMRGWVLSMQDDTDDEQIPVPDDALAEALQSALSGPCLRLSPYKRIASITVVESPTC